MIRFIFTVSLFVCLTPVFTYNQVHAQVTIELGEAIAVTDKSECIKVIEKGKLLTTFSNTRRDFNYSKHVYKGFIYYIQFIDGWDGKSSLQCFSKMPLKN